MSYGMYVKQFLEADNPTTEPLSIPAHVPNEIVELIFQALVNVWEDDPVHQWQQLRKISRSR